MGFAQECPGQKEFSEKVTPVIHQELHRSEERRVGKECLE